MEEQFINVKGSNGEEVFLPVNFFSKQRSLLRICSTSSLSIGDHVVYRGKPKVYKKSTKALYKEYERKASTFLIKGHRCEVLSTNTKAKDITMKHV